MSTSTERAVAALDLRMKAVAADNLDLRAEVNRGRRQRKWFFVSQLASWAAVLVLLALYLNIIMNRSDARDYYNQALDTIGRQIHTLACSVPPGSDFTD